MLRVRDIMTADVLTFSQDISLRSAMEMLASRHVSGAPVVSGDQLVGVISTTDLLDFAAGLPAVPTPRREDEELRLDENGAPPTDEDEPSSSWFVNFWADDGADLTERYATTSGPEWNMLEEYTVGEAMTRAPIRTIASTATVTEAAEYMERQSIHRVLVVDAGKLVGIVTSTDVNRAAAEGKLGRNVYFFPQRARN